MRRAKERYFFILHRFQGTRSAVSFSRSVGAPFSGARFSRVYRRDYRRDSSNQADHGQTIEFQVASRQSNGLTVQNLATKGGEFFLRAVRSYRESRSYQTMEKSRYQKLGGEGFIANQFVKCRPSQMEDRRVFKFKYQPTMLIKHGKVRDSIFS